MALLQFSIVLLGNNDEPKHNLPVTENVAAFYSKVRAVWEPFITRGSENAEFLKKFRATFDQGGYYSVDINSKFDAKNKFL